MLENSTPKEIMNKACDNIRRVKGQEYAPTIPEIQQAVDDLTGQGRLMSYFKALSDAEKVEMIKKQGQQLSRAYKSRERASQALLNHTGARTGVRGGKRTSLDAKLTNYCEIYDDTLEMLKLMTKEL